jgi:hypothetical protein
METSEDLAEATAIIEQNVMLGRGVYLDLNAIELLGPHHQDILGSLGATLKARTDKGKQKRWNSTLSTKSQKNHELVMDIIANADLSMLLTVILHEPKTTIQPHPDSALAALATPWTSSVLFGLCFAFRVGCSTLCRRQRGPRACESPRRRTRTATPTCGLARQRCSRTERQKYYLHTSLQYQRNISHRHTRRVEYQDAVAVCSR